MIKAKRKRTFPEEPLLPRRHYSIELHLEIRKPRKHAKQKFLKGMNFEEELLHPSLS